MTPEENIILQQLHKMESKIDILSTELHNTNVEMTKISGMKYALSDIKKWKVHLEGVVNSEDLREMKKALQDIKTSSENIAKLENELKDIKKDKEKDKEEIEDLKEFKTKTKTVITILIFVFGIAMTVLGWFVS